ncbi:MAG: cytochrome b [Caulobacteraceae bacterium]
MNRTGARLTRYDAVAMSLHWLIAGLILINIGLAWWFGALTGLAKIAPTQLHKSIGITVLLLSVMRLAWRLLVPPPPLPASVGAGERWAAAAVHGLFYVFMIAMPLSGWAMTSASRLIEVYPITLFGLVRWPAIGLLTSLPAAQMHAAHRVFLQTHGLLADLAYGLIILHVAAAVRHQFVRHDDILSRMIPFPRAPAG